MGCRKGDAADAVELPAPGADLAAKLGPGQARGVGHPSPACLARRALPSILKIDELRLSQLDLLVREYRTEPPPTPSWPSNHAAKGDARMLTAVATMEEHGDFRVLRP